MGKNDGKKQRMFTIIELLIVISVIAILAGLLLPALNQAREKGLSAACLGNMKQIYTGIVSYLGDGDDWMPTHRGEDQTNGVSAKVNLYLNQTKDMKTAAWDEEILGFKQPKNVYFCPAIRADLNYDTVTSAAMPADPYWSSTYVPTSSGRVHAGVMGGWLRYRINNAGFMPNVRIRDILNGSMIMAETQWTKAGDTGYIFCSLRLRDAQHLGWGAWDDYPNYRWLSIHAGVINTMFKDGSLRAMKWTGNYLTDADFKPYR